MSRKHVKDMPRDQQKAVFYHLNNPPPPSNYQIRRKMKQRSPKAQSIDRSINAKNIYSIRDKKGKTRWDKHPNRMDIRGIDTIVSKQKYKARVTKKKIKEKKRGLGKTKKKIAKKKQKIQREKKLEERRGMTSEEEIKQARESRVFKRETAKYQREVKRELERREKTEKDYTDKEVKEIKKDIHKLKDLEKQEEQQEKELDKIQEEHVQRKAIIRETREGKGYWAVSQRTIDQTNRLSPKDQRDIVHDVDGWITIRKKGDTKEARETMNSIRKTYKVDSPTDVYFGITGINPYRDIRDKPKSKRFLPGEPRISPSGLELKNTVKLGRLKKSIGNTESRFYNKLSHKRDVENNKKYLANAKRRKDTEKETIKEYENSLEQSEVDYINYKRNYDKYLNSQKETIRALKEDPNIRITTKPSMREQVDYDAKPPVTKRMKSDTHSDVNLEYKGRYVTATKIVPDVDNEALKELNI